MSKQIEIFRSLLARKSKFPYGLIAYFGPDKNTVTKIAAGVALSETKDPIIKHWFGQDIISDPAVISDIGRFFQDHEVNDIVMTDGIVGCPHQEGVDFPFGEGCAYCPYWSSR